MFTDMMDCTAQALAAAKVLQNAYAYAASMGVDLTASHVKATQAGELADVALGLPAGTFANPNGGSNKPPSTAGS